MNLFDMRTVLFGQTATYIVCVLVMGALWAHNRRRYKGMTFWLGAYLLQAAGLVLILLRGYVPAMVSILGGNMLLLAGFLLLRYGFDVFWGKSRANWYDGLFLAAVSGAILFDVVYTGSLGARIVILNLGFLYFSCRCAWAVYAQAPAAQRRSAIHVAAVFSCLGLLAAVRIGLAVFGAPAHDFFASGTADTALVLVQELLIVLLTFSIFLIVNSRLAVDAYDELSGRLEAERVLAGAMRISSLGTWVWDIRNEQVSFCRGLCGVLGFDPDRPYFGVDEIKSRLAPAHAAELTEAAGKALAGGGQKGLELKLEQPGSSPRWIYTENSELIKDSEGRPLLLKGFTMDITRLKEAEEERRKSDEKFLHIFRSAPSAICITRLADGKIIEVNDDFLRETGYTRGEVVGRSTRDLELWVNSGEREAAMAEVAGGGSLRRREYLMRRRSGEILTMEFSGDLLMLDGDGHLLSMARDITKLKSAEEAMRTAQRLESLGTLAGGIAHDFNNMLTGIIGNLSVMKIKDGLAPELRELIKEAETAGNAAKGLAKQLLTFSSGGNPVLAPLDLAGLIRECVAFSLHGSQVSGLVHADGPGVTVMADRDQLFQVMHNLAINAVQAMPGGGKLEVSVGQAELAAGEAPPLAAGRYARITVKDSGTGIPASVMPRLFDPYFSTKGKGRGLGLAVCRSIVHKHGGVISAATGAEGSVFTMYLPLTESRHAEAAQQISCPETGSGRLLVLDDDEIVRNSLLRMTGALGYEAETVTDGEQAVAAWKAAAKAGRPFVAAILDLNISGGMGGDEAAARIRELDPAARIVICSGYAEDSVISGCEAEGFDGRLAKPFSIEALAGALAALKRR